MLRGIGQTLCDSALRALVMISELMHAHCTVIKPEMCWGFLTPAELSDASHGCKASAFPFHAAAEGHIIQGSFCCHNSNTNDVAFRFVLIHNTAYAVYQDGVWCWLVGRCRSWQQPRWEMSILNYWRRHSSVRGYLLEQGTHFSKEPKIL